MDDGIFLFDKKFVIVKFWFVDLDIKNLNVNIVFIWVRLMELDFKYWGKNIFIKLGSLLGKLIKIDMVMVMRELFYYVWILIEVDRGRVFWDY